MGSAFSSRSLRRFRAVLRIGIRYLYSPVSITPEAKRDDDVKMSRGTFNIANIPSRLNKFLFPHIPEHHPLHRKLQLAKSQSKWGRYWDVIMVFMSVYACALYVSESYDASYDAVQIYSVSEIIVTQFFAADFLYNLASSPAWLVYIMAPWTIVDLLTIVPVYVSLALRTQGADDTNVVNLSVLRFIRILRLVRILRMFKMLNGLSGVKRQLITLTLTLLSLLFMAAGIIQFMENDVKQLLEYQCNYVGPLTDWQPSCSMSAPYSSLSACALPPAIAAAGCCDCELHSCVSYYGTNDNFGEPGSVRCPRLTFLTSFYYILVTAATIGYGDITPSNEASRAVVIFIIFTTMTVIPIQVNTLTTLLSMTSSYRQPYDKQNDEHVIICGYVQDWRKLEDILKELLHPDRSNNNGDDDLHVVILSPLEPSEDLKSLFITDKFDGRVTYLVGSALNMNDLQRVKADTASAMFFICNPEIHETASKLDDAATVLRTLSVTNYNSNMSCFVQILKSEDRDILKEAQLDFVLCLDEMKTILQARNCLCPGLSTIVENLFHTFGQSLKEQVGSRSYLSNKQPWLQAYMAGAGKELYSTPLSLAFVEACSFEWSLVVEGIFLSFDCIVVGAYNSQNGDVLMNPDKVDLKKYRYMSKFYEYYDAVIVIADERSQVNRIEGGMNDETVIQMCLKKICIAEDHFAVRRPLPGKLVDGSKAVRTKVAMREITRITKGYGKKQVAAEDDPMLSGPTKSEEESHSSENFLGFLTSKSTVWKQLKSGAMKTASAMSLLTAGPSGFEQKRLGIAREIRERRKTQRIHNRDDSNSDDEEDQDEDVDEEESKQYHMYSQRTRSISEEVGRRSPSMGRQSRLVPTSAQVDDINASIIQDASDLSDHIIVFGCVMNVIHFIAECRRQVLGRRSFRKILVVNEELPPKWDVIVDSYPDAYFLSGNLSSSSTFNKTNIKHAYSIVLLSGRESVTKVEEEYLDADTLFMYMKLEKYIPRHIFFGVELTCASNMAVLNASILRKAANYAALVKGDDPSSTVTRVVTAQTEFTNRVNFRNKETTSHKGSFSNHRMLAAQSKDPVSNSTSGGVAHVKKEHITHDVLSKIITKPETIEIAASNAALEAASVIDDTFWTIDESINMLPVFASGNAYVPNSFDSLLIQSFYDSFIPKACETFICGSDHQTMVQVPIPKAMIGCFFVDLFRAYLSRYILVMALYRGPDEADGNVLSYSLTSPPPDLILRENDRIFAFGNPQEVLDCGEQFQVVRLNHREVSLSQPLSSFLSIAKSTAETVPDHTPTVASASHSAGASVSIPAAPRQGKMKRRGSTLVVIKSNIDATFEV